MGRWCALWRAFEGVGGRARGRGAWGWGLGWAGMRMVVLDCDTFACAFGDCWNGMVVCTVGMACGWGGLGAGVGGLVRMGWAGMKGRGAWDGGWDCIA